MTPLPFSGGNVGSLGLGEEDAATIVEEIRPATNHAAQAVQ
jgi:hypothetical protein